MRHVFILLLVALQMTAADWSRVAALRPGEKVRVHAATSKQTGTLGLVTNDAIRFNSKDGGEVTVPRSEVTRVYVQSRSHRLRNTIIGAAVGVATGVVLYGTLGAMFRNEGNDDTGQMLGVPIAVGAAVAAAMPTGTMKKIYDVKE